MPNAYLLRSASSLGDQLLALCVLFFMVGILWFGSKWWNRPKVDYGRDDLLDDGPENKTAADRSQRP